VKPASVERRGSSLRVVVVPLHNDITADTDFPERRAVVRYVVQVMVCDAWFARRHEPDPLAVLDDGPLGVGEQVVSRQRLADG
jgi:hypothetical protein